MRTVLIAALVVSIAALPGCRKTSQPKAVTEPLPATSRDDNLSLPAAPIQGDETPTKAETERKPEKDSKPSEQPKAIDFDLKTRPWGEYEKNQIAADLKYAGKKVKVASWMSPVGLAGIKVEKIADGQFALWISNGADGPNYIEVYRLSAAGAK
jgi:hypothetical protein